MIASGFIPSAAAASSNAQHHRWLSSLLSLSMQGRRGRGEIRARAAGGDVSGGGEVRQRDVSAAGSPTKTLQLQQDPEPHSPTAGTRQPGRENAREDTGSFPLAPAQEPGGTAPGSPIFDLRALPSLNVRHAVVDVVLDVC
ncbi:hypothetical protein J3F83DRAFT_162926 [Trichoderma novae-zelandiae]